MNNIKGAKGKYHMPTEIKPEDAHLNHIVILTAAANMNDWEIVVRGRVVKINEEATEAVKTQLPKYGHAIPLHDGKQWLAEQAEAEAAGKKEDTVAAEEAATAKQNGEEDLRETIRKQAEEMAELRKMFAEKMKEDTVAPESETAKQVAKTEVAKEAAAEKAPEAETAEGKAAKKNGKA